MEKWREIDGYPLYKVSNHGRIMYGEEIKTFPTNVNRYQRVWLKDSNGRKYHALHRLVMMAFDPISEYKEVNHKNGKKWDNRLENLEWLTKQENMAHAFATGLMDNFIAMTAVVAARKRGAKTPEHSKIKMRAAHNRNGDHPNYKLTDAQVRQIKRARFIDDAPIAELAQRFSTTEVNITLICTGKRRAKVAPEYTIKPFQKRVVDGGDIYYRPAIRKKQILFAKVRKLYKDQTFFSLQYRRRIANL